MRTPEDRFWAKVRVHTRDCPQHPGCWEWLGARTRGGRHGSRTQRTVYGAFWDRRQWRAHRWAYHRWRGRPPRRLVLDHYVCDWALCVHPFHLRPVPSSVNSRRSAQRRWARRSNACAA